MLRGLASLDGPRLHALGALLSLCMRFLITLCVLGTCVWIIKQRTSETELTIAGMIVSAVCGYWFGAAGTASAQQPPAAQVTAVSTGEGDTNVRVQ